MFDLAQQPLFGTDEQRNTRIDKDEVTTTEEIIPLVAAQMCKFTFQWVPASRLAVMGEQFWRVLEVDRTRWRIAGSNGDPAGLDVVESSKRGDVNESAISRENSTASSVTSETSPSAV